MRRLRLLIVDDNPLERTILLRAASALHRFDIRHAADGQAALTICGSELPDIVLSDYEMPVMDGPSFISALRTIPNAENVVVALLTAHQSEETVVAGLAAGADEYLYKPLRVLEVQARLKALCRLAELQLGLNQALSEVEALQSLRIAEQRSRLASFLSSGLSHELNTPLQGLVSNIAFIREHVQDSEANSALDDCMALVERMTATTKRLNDFQKIRARAQPRAVQLLQVLEDTSSAVPAIPTHVVCSPTLEVQLDPLHLRLALAAVVNALADRGGRDIVIEGTPSGISLSGSFASLPDTSAMNALLVGGFDERHLSRAQAEFGLLMANDTLRQNHAVLHFQAFGTLRFGAIVHAPVRHQVSTAELA